MLNRAPNPLYDKTEAFSIRILKMVKCLKERNVEYFILSQVGRSGTSIGANVSESRSAQSRADFVSKLSIALKEADETKYWLNQLIGIDAITEAEHKSMLNDLMEIIYLLTASIKKTKANGL